MKTTNEYGAPRSRAARYLHFTEHSANEYTTSLLYQVSKNSTMKTYINNLSARFIVCAPFIRAASSAVFWANNKKLFYKNTILIFIGFAFITAPLFSSAKFLNENNQSVTTDAEKIPFFSININPDDIFMKIRNFLIITPRKGTTTGLSIDIAVNKSEINKTETWFQLTKDYSINYITIVNGNILQKTGVNVLAVLMFFYSNLYNMFATTFGLIKSILP